MFVCCECCVLSGRSLCDELITRPEESYRLCCVVVCDLETSRMRRPWPALGRSAIEKKKPARIRTAHTYSLTPCSRVLLDKLTGSQLVNKFPALYGTPRFITAFTSARHLSLSWASSNQSISPHPIYWRSILILSSHLHLGLPGVLYPSGFPHQNLVYTSPLHHARYMPRPSHYYPFYHPKNIGWAVQIMKLYESTILFC